MLCTGPYAKPLRWTVCRGALQPWLQKPWPPGAAALPAKAAENSMTLPAGRTVPLMVASVLLGREHCRRWYGRDGAAVWFPMHRCGNRKRLRCIGVPPDASAAKRCVRLVCTAPESGSLHGEGSRLWFAKKTRATRHHRSPHSPAGCSLAMVTMLRRKAWGAAPKPARAFALDPLPLRRRGGASRPAPRGMLSGFGCAVAAIQLVLVLRPAHHDQPSVEDIHHRQL